MKVPRTASGRPTVEYETWVRIRQLSRGHGERPKRTSLDRIDNDGHYRRSNCRWASATTQTRNSRRAHLVTINGVTMCVSAWSEKTGLNGPTIRYRLRHGLNPLEPKSQPSN